jgi:competence protein ComEA
MKYFTLRQQCSIAGIAVCLLIVFAVRHASRTGLFGLTLFSGNTVEKPRPFAVEIVGDVKEPGIYSFANTVHMSEVIEEAGGLKKNLILPHTFTAGVVPNGAQIIIDHEPARCAVTLMNPAKRFLYFVPFNINTAGIEELVLLPGLGDKTARAIVSHREQNGNFTSLDALMKVPGIGQYTFKKIKDYLIL